MSSKRKKLKQRNYLVVIVMRKAVRKHLDRKRKAKQTHQQENDYE
jgi:hypothetical protein